jgi:hypothetical protein
MSHNWKIFASQQAPPLSLIDIETESMKDERVSEKKSRDEIDENSFSLLFIILHFSWERFWLALYLFGTINT